MALGLAVTAFTRLLQQAEIAHLRGLALGQRSSLELKRQQKIDLI